MKNLLKSSLALAFVLLAFAVSAHASFAPSVPEIDASVGIGALTLIAGATTILRNRKR